MNSPAVERSLAVLEDRYQQLLGLGQERFEAFDANVAALQNELTAAREEKDQLHRQFEAATSEKHALELELVHAREDAELCLLQLQQVQQELERYHLDSLRQAEKLSWLRGQRELLVRLLRVQRRSLRALMVVASRAALHAEPSRGMP